MQGNFHAFSKDHFGSVTAHFRCNTSFAQGSVESWLNGFAMELGKTRANYTAIAQGKLGFGFCSSMDFLGIHIGFTNIRVNILKRSAGEGENAGSTSAQTTRQLENLVSDMRGMVTSVRAHKEKVGCRSRA